MKDLNEFQNKKYVYILTIIGVVFLFFLLLNGRYIECDGYAFDQWTGKYVAQRSANVRDTSFAYRLFHWDWD